jgi:hypothetical protein
VRAISLILLAAAAAASEAADQNGHAAVPEVRAIRAPAPIRLDGRLDDAVWSGAEAADSFRQRDPDEGKPATERTELRIAYDDDALYVGVRLLDGEPARIVRRLSRRDESGDADRFTLFLDPRHDHLTGAQFTVTAAGVQEDAIIFNDSWDDDSWDAVWDSAVAIDETGWSLEMRIPFSQLRFPAAETHTWGINAARFIQRKNESAWLELVPKKENGLASRMAHLSGLTGIRPRRALSAIPYVVSRGEFIAPVAGDPFNDGSRAKSGIGVDLKYGLSTNLTLDLTLNPDFGQVEVDPAVVNLTEFETFFQEKRPFFIEGAQIFSNFGRNGSNNFWGFNRQEPILFYSRRIGRSPQGGADADFVDRPQATTILGAAKLTGKVGSGWSVGVLDALTGDEWARTATAGTLGRQQVEPLANAFVARVHRDFPRSGVGFLATSLVRSLPTTAFEEQLPHDSSVFGIDGYHFLSAKKSWVVTGRLAASRVAGSAAAIESIQLAPQHYFQRPDMKHERRKAGATSISGWTGSANLNRNSGNAQLNAAVWATSPGFESKDLGFNFRSDRWGGHVVGTLRKTDPDRLTRRRSFSLAKWYTFNFDRQRLGDGVNAFFNAQLRNYWFIGGNTFYRFRVTNDQLTRGGPSASQPAMRGGGGWVESDERKRVGVNLELFGSANDAGGSHLETYGGLWLKPSSSLTVRFGPSFSRNRAVAQYVTAVQDPLATATYGSRYVFGLMRQKEFSLTTRLNWILTPRMSLQLYAQPLLSAGDYTEFKEFAEPARFEFRRYGSDAGTLAYDALSREYVADPDAAGAAPEFRFGDPDFNFKSLRVNAVFRWEWRLGSTLYVVWTQGRVHDGHPGEFALGRDARDLLRAPSDDVFQVKFTYRVGR